MKIRSVSSQRSGFTLIEALMTIAIIGVMSALVISAFSSASADSNRITARQQQAAVQSALVAWVNGDSNRVDVINAATGDAKMRTLSEMQTDYNSRGTSLARLNLISSYLDSSTTSMFTTATVNSAKIKSASLSATSQHLELPDWSTSSYPQVNLVAD